MPDLAAASPNQAAIEALEFYLDMARSGHLTGLAIAASTRSGKVIDRALPQAMIDADALMAGLSCLTAELTREMLERAVMSP